MTGPVSTAPAAVRVAGGPAQDGGGASAAPFTADVGSSGFTPRDRAVDGMNCMSPSAPAGEVAWALKPDSCEATAASSDGSTPY